MSRLLAAAEVTCGSPKSPIGFEPPAFTRGAFFDRYLTLDGARAYHIGTNCNTCRFFFERMGGAVSGVEIEEVGDALATGIGSLADPVVAQWGAVLPEGGYIACLLEGTPIRTLPGGPDDYFAHEQVALWGIDGFWGLPHFPRTEYYRFGTAPLPEREGLFEFLVPMFPATQLSSDALDRYSALLEEGQAPTAVAISVLDVKAPAVWPEESPPSLTAHWCLTHYLLDGHHKSAAAAAMARPLRLLSFLTPVYSIASPEDIQTVMEALRVAPPGLGSRRLPADT